MTRALRALMGAAIDYAGLFPPAKLPLDEAVANYVRYAGGPDAWMLGKFVCPSARLGELLALLPAPAGSPWPVSALGRGGEAVAGWLDGLSQDVALIDAAEQSGKLRVESFEVRLPAEAFATPDGVARCLDGCFVRSSVGVFFEVPPGPGLIERARTAITALAGRTGFGFKLRCGGLEAAAFPDTSTIATLLLDAAVAGVPLKATAGLHHPIRRWDDAIGAWMHGFVNLFLAGLVVGSTDGPDVDHVDALEVTDPTAFRFSDLALYWSTRGWTLAGIQRMRERVLSFGSCSFDEPRDDLRQLGWLPPAGDAS